MLNIAINTFREIVRNKFLYMILFFAFIFIIFSISLGQLTIGDDEKVIVDFGLAMIEVFGIIGVLFVGSQLLFKEIEGKTIFLILSKPIKRYEFILGKFAGFSATVALIVLFQSLLFLGVLAFKEIDVTNLIVWSLLFTFLKLEILLALVFFFSSFISHILTILVSVMIYLVSHSFHLIIDMAERTQSKVLAHGTVAAQGIFPPLGAMNIKDVIGSFTDFNLIYMLSNTLYAFVYLTVILGLTVLIFNKKKFEG
ncbi:ABC transporter permease [Candidatus Gracilibacteria bacterium]|nr:ABC transporter permease [Candidatus Gracilibacteria bacterium]